MTAREFAEIWGEQARGPASTHRDPGAVADDPGPGDCGGPPRVGATTEAPGCTGRRNRPGRGGADETMEAEGDPLGLTTGFSLHRFVVDQVLTAAGHDREYWERSLWFLTPEVANAAYA